MFRTFVYTSWVPSGETAGSMSSPAPVVTGSGVPPETGTRHRVRLPARADEKMMLCESGVHAGVPPSRRSNVSRRASPPSAGTTHKSPFGPSSARNNAIQRPSGEIAGA